MRGHPPNALDAGVGQAALGVDLRALGFAVTDDIGAHIVTLERSDVPGARTLWPSLTVRNE
jgi:hypothetical protein